MLRVRDIPAADWPEFAARFADLGYEQSLAWSVPAAARLGAVTRFMGIEREGRPVAGAAVRLKRIPGLGRGIAWIASGPLMRWETGTICEDEAAAALAALRKMVVEREGHILRLRPSPASGLSPEAWKRAAEVAGFVPSMRAASYRSFAVSPKHDDDTLMAALHGKWRGHLRKALKSDLEIERGRPDERDLAARFRTLYDEVRESKGFGSALAPEFFFELDGPDFDCEILMARKGGNDVAGIVLGASGRITVYLFGATVAEGRQCRAGYLLTWEGIRLARAQGRALYDLGGVDEVANPDVYHFKQRTGGTPFDAPGPFEARPSGPVPRLIEGLETLRARLKR